MLNKLEKNYTAKEIEEKWKNHWIDNKCFEIDNPLNADYSTALPPPNVTGELHMGHALNCTLQDVLLRYQRLKGKKVHWQVGCDHAGIGTQIVVEKQLAQENITKYDLGKEKFIEKAWEWTDKHKGRIEEQMKLLGCSADWKHSNFTLNEQYAKVVKHAFFQWFKDGLIYQGKRLINWCPKCLTSLSDLEVNHEDKTGKLYQIKYVINNSTDYLEIATSRPETLFGDVAVAINPEDPKYQNLLNQINQGKLIQVKLPLVNKYIPVILSDKVLIGFGTGALKITPAHDFNDAEIAKQYTELTAINIFNDKAEILPLDFIPTDFHGLSREKARELVLEKLQVGNLLTGEEEYSSASATHDRCGTVIEPYLSQQWFVQMDSLAKIALNALKEEKIKFHPERYGKTYTDWLENIQDWCISRQLWWGHSIPIYHKNSCDLDLAEIDEINTKAHELNLEIHIIASEKTVQIVYSEQDNINLFKKYLESKDYKAGTDVLDTWFSSAMWSHASQGWLPETTTEKNIWTNVLSTAREIINLWVSRMIYSSIYFTGKIPFSDIIIHPVVQTPDGKRMSKSKGNSIDPLEMIDLYGADATRLWYCSVGISANQDVKFPGRKDKKTNQWASDTFETNKKFLNKLWNASKFILNNLSESNVQAELNIQNNLTSNLNIWIIGRVQEIIGDTCKYLDSFDFVNYIKTLENFLWDEFCDWYLELIKHILNSEDELLKAETQQVMHFILKQLLKCFHPVIPFVTEELWQIANFNQCNNLSEERITLLTVNNEFQEKFIKAQAEIKLIKETVKTIRSYRQNAFGLAPTQSIDIVIPDSSPLAKINIQWQKLARVVISNKPDLETLFLQKINSETHQLELLFIIPQNINLQERINKLSDLIDKQQKDLDKINLRLSDSAFIQNASESFQQEFIKNQKELQNEITSLKTILEEIQKICIL